MPYKFTNNTDHQYAYDLQCMLNYISGLFSNLQLCATIPSNIKASDLQFVMPHKVYTLNIEVGCDENKNALSNAVLVGKRYIVSTCDTPVGAMELYYILDDRDEDADLQLLQSININVGPYVAATIKAFNILMLHPLVIDGNYEVCILRCGPLFLWSIWLKTADGCNDLIYPLSSIAECDKLRGGVLYTYKEFNELFYNITMDIVNTI